MIHATEHALDKLELLLEKIRSIGKLHEKSRGVFYHKSKAFLHFHEDPTGLFADVRTADDWIRLPVNTKIQQTELVRLLIQALA